MDRGRVLPYLLAFVAALIALGTIPAAAPVALAQPAGCTFGARAVDADTARPVEGMRKTLLETGESVVTGADGVWTFEVPGAGTYTVLSEHPDYQTATHRYVVDDRCQTTGRTQVPNGSAPAPTTAPTAAPTSRTAQAGDVHRLSGRVILEGKAAPSGTRITAWVGSALCGEAVVGTDGRYSIDVLSAAARLDCGLNGSAVQLDVTPRFGNGWLLGTVTFRAGAGAEHDLTWDPRRQRADAANVPWLDVTWEEPRRIAVGICDEMTRVAEQAVLTAFGQWRAAFRTQGLLVELVADGETACSDEQPGIAVIEDVLAEPRAIAGAGHLDRSLKGCRHSAPCAAFKSVIIINRPTLARLSVEERANVIAHEIGHALGLEHARACTGGTIMWEDTRCRFPMATIGVDDIASLNEKVEGVGLAKTIGPDEVIEADGHVSVAPAEDADEVVSALRRGGGGLLSRTPSAADVLATGSVTLLDKERAAALFADE